MWPGDTHVAAAWGRPIPSVDPRSGLPWLPSSEGQIGDPADGDGDADEDGPDHLGQVTGLGCSSQVVQAEAGEADRHGEDQDWHCCAHASSPWEATEVR